ncbi:Cyclic nucleotide-gated cation channel beta-1, partial [Ophiophagus hannah]
MNSDHHSRLSYGHEPWATCIATLKGKERVGLSPILQSGFRNCCAPFPWVLLAVVLRPPCNYNSWGRRGSHQQLHFLHLPQNNRNLGRRKRIRKERGREEKEKGGREEKEGGRRKKEEEGKEERRKKGGREEKEKERDEKEEGRKKGRKEGKGRRREGGKEKKGGRIYSLQIKQKNVNIKKERNLGGCQLRLQVKAYLYFSAEGHTSTPDLSCTTPVLLSLLNCKNPALERTMHKIMVTWHFPHSQAARLARVAVSLHRCALLLAAHFRANLKGTSPVKFQEGGKRGFSFSLHFASLCTELKRAFSALTERMVCLKAAVLPKTQNVPVATKPSKNATPSLWDVANHRKCLQHSALT